MTVENHVWVWLAVVAMIPKSLVYSTALLIAVSAICVDTASHTHKTIPRLSKKTPAWHVHLSMMLLARPLQYQTTTPGVDSYPHGTAMLLPHFTPTPPPLPPPPPECTHHGTWRHACAAFPRRDATR